MFRNSLNYSICRFRSHLLLINSKFSSQEIKPLEKINENKNVVNARNEESTESSSESSEKSEKNSITEREKNEISKLVKEPLHYDSFWEYMSIEEKEYNKKTDYLARGRKGFSTNFYAMMHNKYDFSIQGFKRKLKFYIQLREKYNQRYIAQRHGILGPELATAHFVCYRGGKVKFMHSPNIWIEDIDLFPNKYDKRYKLLAVDASNLRLEYEAFDNLSMLQSLQELNLSGNKNLDDWSCDKIGRLFRNSTTLTTLNLSNNPLITNRGIETLHRLRSLRKLIISGTNAAQYPFIELLILLFNDLNPECEIIV